MKFVKKCNKIFLIILVKKFYERRFNIMLKKLFIKNYKDTDNPEVRNQYGKVAGIFGIITNLVLGIIKLVTGIISHSVSIMADAANNIADTASSLLTIIGFKLSNKKPDSKHPYGYARYEYVAGFVIAILMLIMGLSFAKESIVKIINPEELITWNQLVKKSAVEAWGYYEYRYIRHRIKQIIIYFFKRQKI